MAREDIEKMISEALGADDEATKEYSPPRRPLPHGHHILSEYVKLCEQAEPHRPDPSADVELPLPPVDAAPPSSGPMKLSSVLKNLARVKR